MIWRICWKSINVFCEKFIPTEKIVSRNIKNVGYLHQPIKRRLRVTAFILTVVPDSGLKFVGHLLGSNAPFFPCVIKTIRKQSYSS